MVIDTEEKAKIAVLAGVGIFVATNGFPLCGCLCLLVMLPWGIITYAGEWLTRTFRNRKEEENN